MSIPVNQLVYGGIYDNAKRYTQYTFVVSPIDGLCYVNINPLPAQGTGDPSIQPSAYWLLFPNVTGDITAIVTSTGLSGGGTTGSVTLTNIGVISLDGQTGALTTQTGQFYKTTGQTIGGTAGPAVATTITFDASTPWSNTTYLAYDTINNLWNVTQRGVYHLQVQLNYANMNNPNFGDDTHLININVGRGLVTNSPIRNAFDWKDASPTNPDNFAVGIYELQVGDKVQIQVVDHFQNTNTYTILGQSAGANSYDYNSFFTWALIKPLP